jgi:hypothetical protein
MTVKRMQGQRVESKQRQTSQHGSIHPDCVSCCNNSDLAGKCEATQNKHKHMLTAVSKKVESILRGSDRRHNWEL